MGCRRSSEPLDLGVSRRWSRAGLDVRWGSAAKALWLLLRQLVAEAAAWKLDVLVRDEMVLRHASPEHAPLGDTHRQGPVQTALIVIVDERVADESAQTVDDVSPIEVPRIESISWRIPSKSMTNISGLYG